MRRHHKYHLPDRRRANGGRFFFRLLVVLVLLTALGTWWLSHKPTVTLPRPAPAGTTTNRVSLPPPAAAAAAAPVQTNVVPLPLTSAPPANVAGPRPAGDVFPRPAGDVLEAQVALARLAISPGPLDGLMGPQTRAAILAFQRKLGVTETLELDDDTRARLVLPTPPLTNYVVTTNDLARLQPLRDTWLGKSQQSALDYETILELVAEKGHAAQSLIRRLNPAVAWTNVAPGTEVRIPDVTYPKPAGRAGFVVISLGEKKLDVFDAATNLVAHFPCSIAARVEKRPAGELQVAALAPNPDYTFDPAVFPESAEARQLKGKLILPPGPNNPVGTAWISLDRPGYGIHGTPSPEQVGRTESHGCFRLANWDAEYLLKLAWVGMPVYVEP